MCSRVIILYNRRMEGPVIGNFHLKIKFKCSHTLIRNANVSLLHSVT